MDDNDRLIYELLKQVALRDDYNYFSPLTIGGPTGNYILACPVTSCRWAEYKITAVANGDGGSASVFVTGDNDTPSQVLYDGTKTLTDDAFLRGVPIRVASTVTLLSHGQWTRITHSQKRVFVRIDAGNNSSCYVSIQFRVKPITVVPGLPVTVHPDHAVQLNIARAETTLKRLDRMGIPMEDFETHAAE